MIRPVPYRSSVPSPVQVTVGLKTASEFVIFWSAIVSVLSATNDVVSLGRPGRGACRCRRCSHRRCRRSAWPKRRTGRGRGPAWRRPPRCWRSSWRRGSSTRTRAERLAMKPLAGVPPSLSASVALVATWALSAVAACCALGTPPSADSLTWVPPSELGLCSLGPSDLFLTSAPVTELVDDRGAGDLERGVAGAGERGEERRERDDEARRTGGGCGGRWALRTSLEGVGGARSTGPRPVYYGTGAN